MANIIKKTIIFILAIITFIGCEKNNMTETAVRYSIEDIQKSPDFNWYQWEYDIYNFNSSVINNIAGRFDKNELKVIIFTSPSCFCGSLYTKFPQIIKVLDNANITENNYEIYVTIDTGEQLQFEHPYSNLFAVNTLPSIYLLKFGSLEYDLLSQATTKKISIEEALLDGLIFFGY